MNSKEKIWIQSKMPETNVNRLARNIENAQKVVESLNAQIRRKYFSRNSASMTENGRKLLKQREEIIQKITNMNAKLKTMNREALQVQLRKINNRRKNLDENLNKAMEGYGFAKRNLIQKAFREYAHWSVNDPKKRANKFRNLEAKLKNLPTTGGIRNVYFKKIAPIALQYARIGMNENALKKAVELRKRHLAREKPARNKLRSIIKQKVLPPIKENINYGPYGRETLNAMRRFPGFKEKTLEEYAMVVRQRNRLQRELANLRRSIKRNNNNRN
jgi:hypothetical protein